MFMDIHVDNCWLSDTRCPLTILDVSILCVDYVHLQTGQNFIPSTLEVFSSAY